MMSAEKVRLALVPGASSQTAGEIQTLLRKRLLIIVVVCWTAFLARGAVFVWQMADAANVSIYLAVLAATGALAGLLWSRRALSLRQLRWIEIAVFAIIKRRK